MKRLILVCALVALTASQTWAATYTLQFVNNNTNWYNPIWDTGGYPGANGDVAIISNANVSFPAAELRVYLGISTTVGVIRTVGFTTNAVWPTISSDNGGTLYLQNPDGRALIEGAGFNGQSWQLHMNCRMTLLSDLAVTVVSNKTIMFGNAGYDFAGASNLYLRNLHNSFSALDTRVSASPNFTGIVYVQGSPYVAFGHDTANRYIMTNALIDVLPGTAAMLRPYTSNLGYRVICRSGSTLMSYVNASVNLRTPVEIHGWVTNGLWASGYAFKLFGDISGTGTIFRSGMSARMTNVYVGSVSPGLGGPGTIAFMSSLVAGGTTAWANVILLGEAGDPLLLNIENSDQVIATNLGAKLDLTTLDVRFLNTTTPGTTNWFLQASDGFTGGAFNNIDWGIFNGHCVSNVSGMESYIGAVVMPEPALLLLSLCGMLAVRVRRR